MLPCLYGLFEACKMQCFIGTYTGMWPNISAQVLEVSMETKYLLFDDQDMFVKQ